MADTLVISQTATSITVEQQSGDQSRTIEYAFDGTETTVEVGNGTLTVTASWDGATLVTRWAQKALRASKRAGATSRSTSPSGGRSARTARP